MDPARYCEDEILVPGTPHHYAIGPADPRLRRELCALFALERGLKKSAFRPADASIAQTRLAWWHDELDRLSRAVPRHPITRALESMVPKYGLDVEIMHAMAEALWLDRTSSGYGTFPELERRCLEVESRIIEMATRVCEPAASVPTQFSLDLGVGLALARMICDFGHDVRNQRIFIPRDEIERFAISLTDLEGQEMHTCLNYQVARAIEYIDQALRLLPSDCEPSQRPVQTLAAINLATLQEFRSLPTDRVSQTVAITPLRMWWIAFRTYRLGWLGVRKGAR